MSGKTIRKAWVGGFVALVLLAFVVSAMAEEGRDPSKPIKNLQFQAADIRSVLTFLADYGGVNVVVSPKVQGTVTIKLTDVLWRDAMNIIGRTYDLAVVDEASGYIRVMPAVEYRLEQSEERKHDQEQRQLVPLETKIVTISNSTSGDIVKSVKGLMTERGVAISDERSNSVIIQEVPTNLPTVLGYISELDKPSKQIKISTQLVELSTNSLEEYGVDWTASGTYTTESGRSYKSTGEVKTERLTDNSAGYKLTALQHGWSVEAIVQAIVSSGKGKIVAHPEITTLDNKEAKIQMGQKVPVKQYDEAGNVVIKFEQVGTILTVTPHITAENQILMYLKPERSTYEFDANGVIINTNNAETHVIVANGQTAVIGGLTTQDETRDKIGVPFLKDIPIVGMLFSYSRTRTESRDLVIFVTPNIVDENLAVKP